jgi:hypothetical protein
MVNSFQFTRSARLSLVFLRAQRKRREELQAKAPDATFPNSANLALEGYMEHHSD